MNPLFGMLNGRPEKAPETAPEAPANRQPQMDWNTAMRQIQANPAGMLKQAGYNVPESAGNDPQKMVMHLIRSGQVGGPMMRMIQPMLARMGVK